MSGCGPGLWRSRASCCREICLPSGGAAAPDCRSVDLSDLLQDLLDEQWSLDEIVAALDDGQWDLPTPSPRWSVTDQIGHLCYFDGAAVLAIRDPDAFAVQARRLMEASLVSETSGDDFTLGDFRALSPSGRLDRWRSNRQALADAVGTLGERDRVRWYGPSMGAKSFVTARLMEAWAHGQDVCDTVAASRRKPTDRLRHVAQLGCITRAWTYVNRGLPAPDGDVRVELTCPVGCRLDVGRPGRIWRQPGERPGVGLLPGGHAAPQCRRHRLLNGRRGACSRVAVHGAGLRGAAHRRARRIRHPAKGAGREPGGGDPGPPRRGQRSPWPTRPTAMR